MENHIKILGVLPRIQYIANGENTTFEFPFAIFKNENVEVYLGDILQNTNTYTVSGAGQTEGGSITFASAPAQGTVITIYRNLDIERTTDFQEGGALRANALNYELDYQTACQQQIADSLNRSMLLPPYAVDTDIDLTLPIPSAGKAIVWSSNGTNLENSTVSVNELESTLLGYKTAAESAATTATTKAGVATDKADVATQKAQLASDKADIATAKAAEAEATLSAKANKDMDNLSVTGKSAVIAWGMPDYSAGVAVTFPYTAPSDGVIFYSWGSGGASSDIVINNVIVGQYKTDYGNIHSQKVYLSRGDVIAPSGGSVQSSFTQIFFPLKGVN